MIDKDELPQVGDRVKIIDAIYDELIGLTGEVIKIHMNYTIALRLKSGKRVLSMVWKVEIEDKKVSNQQI